MTALLSRLAGRHRRLVLSLTVVFTLVAGVVGTGAFTALNSGDAFSDPDQESVRADERIAAATGIASEPGVVALVEPVDAVTTPAGRARVDEVEAALALLAGPAPGGPQPAAAPADSAVRTVAGVVR